MIQIEEQLLTAIAKRSWCAYVTAQLAESQAAVELWQQRSQQSSEFCTERVHHELAYYTRQVARWRQTLDRIGAEE